MATERTIKLCFDRVKLVFTKYLAPDEYAGLLEEWVAQLTNYSEAAVLDATEELVVGETWPTMLQVLTATQAAARAIKEEQQFVWGRQHPEDDPNNVDAMGMKRLVALIREQFGLRDANETLAGRRDLYLGHERHVGHKAVGGASARECPVCGQHDHSDSRMYCAACAFDDQGIQLGDPNKLLYLCREQCDPVSHLVLVQVDDRNVPLPDGVLGRTDAVYPCPRCRPEDHEAWRQGTWGSRGGKKAKSKRVNDSAYADD